MMMGMRRSLPTWGAALGLLVLLVLWAVIMRADYNAYHRAIPLSAPAVVEKGSLLVVEKGSLLVVEKGSLLIFGWEQGVITGF